MLPWLDVCSTYAGACEESGLLAPIYMSLRLPCRSFNPCKLSKYTQTLSQHVPSERTGSPSLSVVAVPP